MFTPGVSSANCFVVSDLKTHWQRAFSKVYINFGDRRNTEYEITIEGDRARIMPGNLDCIVDSSDQEDGVIRLTCGLNLLVESVEESSNSDTGLYVELSTITGTVEESWTLLPDQGSAVVFVNKKNAKPYNGVVRAAC